MVQTLRNLNANKMKGQGTIAPGGIYVTGIMNDGTWAAGGFRITNTSGGSAGDLGIAAGLVTGTAQGVVLSYDCRYALVRSNNSGWQTGIVKKAAASGNFAASVSNLHTVLGLGVSLYMGAAAWMPDNRHFWISGPATNSVTAGTNLMYLCRYDPDTNTVTLVDTYDIGAGGAITQMILSPDHQRLLVLNNTPSSDGFIVFVLGPGYRVKQRINTTGSTQSPNTAFWHPRLNLFGYTQFITGAPLVLKRWNGTSYVDVTVSAVPAALTRGGGFIFSGRVLWLLQGTTCRLYDLSNDGVTFAANATITPPTVIAATTENPKYRSQDDLAQLGLFQTASGAFILASNDLPMKGEFTTPMLSFASQVGVEVAAALGAQFPKLEFAGNARRNEYFALDAQYPKMASAIQMANLYGSLAGTTPKMDMNAQMIVLDEPYEPFEGRYELSNTLIALTADPVEASSEDAGQFAYSLGFNLPMMQAELTGSQDANVTAEFIVPKLMLADIRAGMVPEFTGEFIFPKLKYDAFSALFPTGALEAEFPLAEFAGEGVLPSDVAILEALFSTLDAEIEAFAPPGGFLEAEFFAPAFEAEGIVPYGAFVDATFPTLDAEGSVNVPIGALLEADFMTLDAAFDVMVPTSATLTADFPVMTFDSLVEVPSVGMLDAVTPLMQADTSVVFMYDAELEANFPLLEFAGEPPLPVDVDLAAEFTRLEADLFGGPTTQADFEPVFPLPIFDSFMQMGPRVDANIRFIKMTADIRAKFVITAALDAQFPTLQADLFGGQTVEGDLEAIMPGLLFRGAVRFGEPSGGGDTFVTAYHKKRRHGKAFSPIHARF